MSVVGTAPMDQLRLILGRALFGALAAVTPELVDGGDAPAGVEATPVEDAPPPYLFVRPTVVRFGSVMMDDKGKAQWLFVEAE